MPGFFQKFKSGFARTVAALSDKTRGLFGGRKLDAASLAELEDALYTADFGVETTAEIMAEIKAAYRRDPELQGRQAAGHGHIRLPRLLGAVAGDVREGVEHQAHNEREDAERDRELE